MKSKNIYSQIDRMKRFYSVGDFVGAVKAADSILKYDKSNIFVLKVAGVSKRKLGKYREAMEYVKAGIRITPVDYELINTLGNLYKDLGNIDRARAEYERSIAIKEDFVEGLVNYSELLLGTNEYELASKILAKVIFLCPNYPMAYINLGAVLKRIGRYQEAYSVYVNYFKIESTSSEAFYNFGNLQMDLGLFDDAEISFRNAIEINPDHTNGCSNLLFCLDYHPDKTATEIYDVYKDVALLLEPNAVTAKVDYKNGRDTSRRLRIGYVSPDFKMHVCNLYVEPLLSRHNKNEFDVFAYAELEAEDFVTERYKKYFDHWIPTKGMSDDNLYEKILSDRIDILIDIAGHSANNRLGVFTKKPAPVTVTWIVGYGYTTGLKSIDYIIADSELIPIGSEHLFSEKPWRLEGPSYCYRPNDNMGVVSELPRLRNGYISFGVLSRSIRINHNTIRVWSDLLNQVPNSKLVIDNASYKNSYMQEELLSKFLAQGIAGDRLQIGNIYAMPWDACREIDIVLDCFPNNTGTSILVALFMGVPVVTLRGRPSLGRIGALNIKSVGHPEWIAEDEEEYITIAKELSADVDKLVLLRASLRSEMRVSEIMNEEGFAVRMEDAYKQMWKNWCK